MSKLELLASAAPIAIRDFWGSPQMWINPRRRITVGEQKMFAAAERAFAK